MIATLRRNQVFPAFLVIFLILAFKSNDALTHPQFFAEDVSIFFKAQLGHSFPELWVPYAGYLHVVPRMVAWFGSWFGMAKAPLIYNLMAILVSAAAVSYTCHRMKSIIPIPLALLSFMAVPLSGEILGTITNAQWFLQFALATACLTEPDKSELRYRCARDVTILMIALTGPFSIIVMIVVGIVTAASWIDRRTGSGMFDGHLSTFSRRLDLRVIGLTAIGAFVQLALVLTHAPDKSEAQRGMLELLRITFVDLAPIHLFGADFLTGNGWLAVYVLLLLPLVFGKGMAGDKRLVVLAMFAYASAEMFAPVRLKEVTPLYQFMLSDRYFYVFKVTFWWVVYAGLVARGYFSRSEASLLAAIFIGIIAMTNVDHLRRRPFADLHWKETAKELKQPGSRTIFVNPPGWGVQIDTPVEGPAR